MAKVFAAALAATALVGAGVLTQSVTTSASTNIVGTVETEASAAAAPLAAAEEPLPSRLSAMQAVAPNPGQISEYTVSGSVTHGVNTSGAIEVDGFDKRGTLTGVTVKADIGGRTVGSYENRGLVDYPFFIETSSRFKGQISGPGIADVAYSGTFVMYDRTIPIGEKADLAAQVATGEQERTVSAANLSDYTEDKVTFTTLTSGDFVNNANADGTLILDSSFEGLVKVTYSFTVPASIGITKTVDTGTGVTTPDFTFAVSCDDGFAGTATINGAGTTVVAGMAIGSTCTVTEQAPASGSWVAMVGDVCTNVVSGVKPGETATITNRLWAGAYDACAPLPT